MENKTLICVLCGHPWGAITNRCENEQCNGFGSWGYELNKPESFSVQKDGKWVLKEYKESEKIMESKKVALIGGGKSGFLHRLTENKTVIVVEPLPQHRETFEIQGVVYAPIEKNESVRPIGKLHGIMDAAHEVYSPYMTSYKSERRLPKDIDIIKEYEFILLKKSKLSKWEREKVVWVFNRNFEKVSEKNASPRHANQTQCTVY